MFDAQDLPGSVSAQTDSPSLPVPGGAQPVHVLDRLAAIFKHRRLAGAAFVLVVGVMMVQTYSQMPMYRTSSRVIIQDERTVAVGNLNANDPVLAGLRSVLQHPIQHSAQPRPRASGSCGGCSCRIIRSSTGRHRAGRALPR